MPRHEQRIVQHISWKEVLAECICGQEWPCIKMAEPIVMFENIQRFIDNNYELVVIKHNSPSHPYRAFVWKNGDMKTSFNHLGKDPQTALEHLDATLIGLNP